MNGNSEEFIKYSKQRNLIAILVTVVILLILGIIAVIMLTKDDVVIKTKTTKSTTAENDKKTTDDDSKKADDTKKDESKEDKKEEVKSNEKELPTDSYKYLVDRLYSSCTGNLDEYININKLSNETKIFLAINSLEPKKVNVKNNDEIDLTGCKKEKNIITTSKGVVLDTLALNDYKPFYLASDVDNKAKELFGTKTVITHKTIGDAFYDKTSKLYILPGHGCKTDYDHNWFQKITKITQEDKYIYAYVVTGSIIDATTDKPYLCYNYDYSKIDKKDCILISKIGNKYKNNDEYGYDYEKYAADNKDKFTKYKYTFEKEDNNYVIKKLEKID